MPYTTKDATATLLGYLNVLEKDAKYISNTNKRGLLYDASNNEAYVVFIYPISHKADNTKNFFDTRDSGSTERSIAWKYALDNNLKYFCLAVHDRVSKFKDYIFSLECDEKIVQEVSGVVDGVKRKGGGTQVVIPNDYTPSKPFERIRTKNHFWISVIHKDRLFDYLEKFDSRPYLGVSDITIPDVDEEIESEQDEYHLAAKIVTNHIQEAGIQFDVTIEELDAVREELLSKYSPDKLAELTDKNLLQTIFYSVDMNNESLCYFLEFNVNSRKYFGSISGGSAFKFGLFQKSDDGQWTTGSPIHPQKLSEEEALKYGKKIRDYLVNGAKVIEETELNTPEDYEVLNTKLYEVTEGSSELAWMHKYFVMMYPDKLTSYHNTDWQKHILYSLKIKPSATYYGRDGQISIIRRYANLPYAHFFRACFDKFGGIKKFCRLDISDDDGNHAKELLMDSCVGIGWNKLGDLTGYVSGGKINKKAITDTLVAEYFPEYGKGNIASRKAGELFTFYDANADTIFVVMDGDKPLALVDEIGDNYFDAEKVLGHRRMGKWHKCFKAEDKLPNTSVGHMTTCYELSDEENLMYLYKKYYYSDDVVEDAQMNILSPYTPPVYRTYLKTKYAMNRIIFGAPGTGKSFRLECDRIDILQNGIVGDFERVTFHPDYSYSQFMGTYKPVCEGREIYYKFVPGPFMRIYVEAIKNGRTNNPQPYVLLIEEINRAKVAAVFGDIFQLLDRDDYGVSQYEIQASEDIRKHLADELGGEPNDYRKIMLPNNMFIWATMNSADQGVFPMDTAFKRRWNFEYLGIDANEDKVISSVELVDGKVETNVSWNKLRKAINEKLSCEFKVNEDKLIGPFFLSAKVIEPEKDGSAMKDPVAFREAFKSKVLMYLYEDAAKQYKHKLFSGCNNIKYSAVCDAFESIGMEIFGEEFKEKYYDKQEG